ncbi:MAG: bL35 family ribosomal protein [bacterium]
MKTTKRRSIRSLTRRVKVTGTGKVMRRTQNMRHRRSHKGKAQIRRMKAVKFLTAGTARRIKKILGI